VIGVLLTEHASVCEKLTRAEALLRTRCPEEPWLLTQVRSTLASCWFWLGKFGADEETFERWLAEAMERDDRFAIASLEAGGSGCLRFLLRDEPECVRERLREATAGWPREPFSVVHLGELGSLQFAALYVGGDGAFRHLEGERARHQRAFLLKTGFGRESLSQFRVQASLSAYCTAERGPLAVHYLRITRTESRAMRRSKGPFARATWLLIEAQLAAIDGETERALALTRTAVLEAARPGHGFAEAPLGYLEGLLVGGEAGREKRVQALALAAAQGWKNPRRFVAMHCPVIDYLEAKA